MGNLAYIVKVWGITCFISPIALIIPYGFDLSSFKIDDFQVYWVSVILGLILSAPVFIIMGYFLYYFAGKLKKLSKLLFLSIIGTIGTFATFAVVDSNSFFHIGKALYFPLTYSIIMIISILIFHPKST